MYATPRTPSSGFHLPDFLLCLVLLFVPVKVILFLRRSAPTATSLGHYFGALGRRGRRGRRRGRGGTPGDELAQLRLERAPIAEVVEPGAFDRCEADCGEERQALH